MPTSCSKRRRADPVVALAFADRPTADSETVTETMARPEDTEGLEDHVRMYLREIGLVPLLSWDGEKRLARRMEEGVYLERLAREVQQEPSSGQRGDRPGSDGRARAPLRGRASTCSAHWFPTLEPTLAGYRTAITTLGETAEISADRCQELAAGCGLLRRDGLREDLVELSTLCRLVPDEVRDWVANRRAEGDTGPLCPIVGRALTVDPRRWPSTWAGSSSRPSAPAPP